MAKLDYQQRQQQQQGLMLPGVVPNPASPSAGLLQIECDVTGLFTDKGADYIRYVEDRLSRVINEKDAKYARMKSKLRGRGVDMKLRLTAVQKNTGTKEKPVWKVARQKVRIITMMPYPSVFASRLSSIRRQLWRAIGDDAIVLSSYSLGRRKFNTYFMLEDRASKLTTYTEGLNVKIHDINSDIEDYERSRDFTDILSVLKQDIPPDKWSRPPPIHTALHDIRLNFSPMPISRYIIESYTDDAVKREIRKNIQEKLGRISEEVATKLGGWVQNLSQALVKEITTTDVVAAEKHLSELKQLTETYQVQDIVSRDLLICQNLLEAIRTKDQTTIDEATRQVAQMTGVDTADKNTRRILAEASLAMNDIPPEARSLIESML